MNGETNMKYNELIETLNIDRKLLDKKKEQTDYKIKYVVEYVKKWLYVSVNRDGIKNITFIDSMCNAGIYDDGDLSTAMAVYLLFLKYAQDKPGISFNLLVNDYNKERIKIFEQIATSLNIPKPCNIHLHTSTKEVNDYLDDVSFFGQFCRYQSSVILYVDPYDFGTVKISKITNFISKYYCEVIFNFFISDYVRNGVDNRIRACIGENQISNKEELISHIGSCLKVGKMKYYFSYQFKTKKNTELYQIIFVTPHHKGLEKLKEALWDVFNGKFNHRNRGESTGQLSFFSECDEKEQLEEIHAKEAKLKLLEEFAGKKVSYGDISTFLMEYTMMMNTHIINKVLRPLIQENKLTKNNMVSNSNYKNDSYFFKEESKQ